MSSVRGPTRLDSSCRMLKKNGYSNVLEDCCQGKCFAEDPGTEKEHGNIEDIDKGCDRYMEHILTEKRQSCCAAGDQIIRKNKKGNSDSINQIAQGNDQKIVKGF